jgi:hypothetical protein
MSRPQHDLLDFMQQTSDTIQAEYARIVKRSHEDPGTTGEEGEENWKALLKNWLPPQFPLVTRGRLIFVDGHVSPQIDLLILNPAYPPGLLHKKLYLSAGVIAAFECKITLRSGHINEASKTAEGLTKHLPSRTGSPYREMNRPMVYGLLAHSHEWKARGSKPAENVQKHLDTINECEIKHPREMLDLLCVSDLGTWTASKTHLGGKTILTGYASHQSSLLARKERAHTHVGSMVLHLLMRLGRERPEIRPFVEYFYVVGIGGSTETHCRAWPADLYSEEVRSRLPQIASQNWRKGQYSGDFWSDLFWGEWDSLF